MAWYRRDPPESGASGGAEDAPAEVERASPGVAALFEGAEEGGGHAILDLGSAAPRHLKLFGRFARQIRFAGLLPKPPRGMGWTAALEGLPPNPSHPYDLVLLWDVLDRLDGEQRELLVEILDRITGRSARIYAVVDASGERARPRLHHTLVSLERVVQREQGPPVATGPQLLPAHVERLLAPFEVVRAFTLRQGLREYVAVKGGMPRSSTRVVAHSD